MKSPAPALARRCSAGITIIELMTVLAVSAIVLAFGAPAAVQWLRNVETRSSAHSLVAALQLARAEAIARNAFVRLRLTDARGRPGWEIGCLRVSARCPETIRRQPVIAATEVRWGVSASAAMPPFSSAIRAGTGLPSAVTFDALGTAAAVGTGTEVARIDITHARGADTRRWVIQIAAQGMVRLCDPLAGAERLERCQ